MSRGVNVNTTAPFDTLKKTIIIDNPFLCFSCNLYNYYIFIKVSDEGDIAHRNVKHTHVVRVFHFLHLLPREDRQIPTSIWFKLCVMLSILAGLVSCVMHLRRNCSCEFAWVNFWFVVAQVFRCRLAFCPYSSPNLLKKLS